MKAKGDEAKQRECFGGTTLFMALLSGLITAILLVFLYPLLELMGAEGEILSLTTQYVRVIALGTVCQLLATGFVPFIRNMGGATFAMAAMIAGFVANIVLDYVFVWIFDWGMAGNEQAVAVYSCISYVVCIAYLLLQGVGDGSQPLISRCYGENDITGMVRIRGLAYKTAYGITVACMAGLFLGRDLVGVLFGASADACREVAFYLPFFLATLLFVSFVRVTTSYFYATEKTGLSYALVFAEPLFQLVLLLLLPLFLGLLGVWLAVPLAQVLAWIVSVCAKRRVDHKIQMAGKE